jgi:hypothetical protein
VKEISGINKKINKSSGSPTSSAGIPMHHQSPFTPPGSGGFTLTNPDPDEF